MTEWLERTERLLGVAAVRHLAGCRVAVFGLGGVGGHAVEALARSGVGSLDLIDHDTVSLSNCNRQIIATRRTVGMAKTEAMRQRLMDINPELCVRTYPVFFGPDTAELPDFRECDYVADAIDSVAGKVEIIVRAHQAGVPVISAMGAGNKLDPAGFEVADIYATSVCPLARVMRKELRARGIPGCKVVYSREEPRRPAAAGGRPVPGSLAFVSAAAGLVLAGAIVRDLVANYLPV